MTTCPTRTDESSPNWFVRQSSSAKNQPAAGMTPVGHRLVVVQPGSVK
jgi:hypothetical protein